jgi:hypothetical protein
MLLTTFLQEVLISSALASPTFTARLLECPVSSPEAAARLESCLDLDIWSHGIVAGHSVDVHVKSTYELIQVGFALNITEADCTVKVEDVGKLLRKNSQRSDGSGDFFSDYQPFPFRVCGLSVSNPFRNRSSQSPTKLLNSSFHDPRLVQDWLNRAEIYVLPMQNPDGYIYSGQSDRLWRKNRSVNSDGSFGVDLNRNWDNGQCILNESYS